MKSIHQYFPRQNFALYGIRSRSSPKDFGLDRLLTVYCMGKNLDSKSLDQVEYHVTVFPDRHCHMFKLSTQYGSSWYDHQCSHECFKIGQKAIAKFANVFYCQDFYQYGISSKTEFTFMTLEASSFSG